MSPIYVGADEITALKVGGQDVAKVYVGATEVWSASGLVRAGLVAEYRLDEGSGQVVNDSSGNGWVGQLGSAAGVDTNDPAWFPSGGLKGDGVDDYVMLTSPSITSFEGLTISVYIDPLNSKDHVQKLDRYHDLVTNHTSPYPAIVLRTYTSQPGPGYFLRLDLNLGGTPASFNHPLTAQLSGPVVVTATYDKATSMARFYLDGVEVDSADLGKSGVEIRGNVSRLLGREGGTTFSDMPLMHVSVYDRALSASEVAVNSAFIKETTPVAPTVTRSGLITEYRFDENTGQVLTDYMGTRHGQIGSTTGTDTNDPAWLVAGLDFAGDDLVMLGDALRHLNPWNSPFGVVMVFRNELSDGSFRGLFTRSSPGNRSGELSYYNGEVRAVIGDALLYATASVNTWLMASYGWNGPGTTAYLSVNAGTRVTATPGSHSTYADDTRLGRSPGGFWLDGQIGYLLIYNRPLTQAEELTVYQILQGTMDLRGVTL